MPHKNSITTLEASLRLVENRIDGNVGNIAELEKLKSERSTIIYELSRLRKMQWEEDHERVNFEDER
jgi:hypothetical protein